MWNIRGHKSKNIGKDDSTLPARTERPADAIEKVALIESDFLKRFYSSPEPGCLLENGKIVGVNDAALDMFGLERRDLEGKSFADLSPCEQPDGSNSQEKCERNIHAGLLRGLYPFSWFFRRSSGSTFPVDVLLVVIPYHSRLVLLARLTDISERKRDEEMLKQVMADLKRFWDAAVDRELEMIELKKQVNALSRELGRKEPYDLAFLDRQS